MRHIQVPPGLFVQHIRVQALWPQKTDLCDQSLPLGDELVMFGLKREDLVFDPRTANQTKLAIQGMKAEIAQRRKGGCRNDKAPQNRLFTLTGWSRHDGDLNARTMASCESECDSAGLTVSFADQDNSHKRT